MRTIAEFIEVIQRCYLDTVSEDALMELLVASNQMIRAGAVWSDIRTCIKEAGVFSSHEEKQK